MYNPTGEDGLLSVKQEERTQLYQLVIKDKGEYVLHKYWMKKDVLELEWLFSVFFKFQNICKMVGLQVI